MRIPDEATRFFGDRHGHGSAGYRRGGRGVPSAFLGLTRIRGDVRSPLPGGAIDSGDVVESRD